ncbi:MAG: 4Fe-4S binding protein [Nanoarchaeota archaeon]|nr:4Fe-4S binding protein [Nanoarchaeota archaeon]
MVSLEWNEKRCKKCNICVDVCPQKILKWKDGKLIMDGKCIKCRMCEKFCPDIALKIKDE